MVERTVDYSAKGRLAYSRVLKAAKDYLGRISSGDPVSMEDPAGYETHSYEVVHGRSGAVAQVFLEGDMMKTSVSIDLSSDSENLVGMLHDDLNMTIDKTVSALERKFDPADVTGRILTRNNR